MKKTVIEETYEGENRTKRVLLTAQIDGAGTYSIRDVVLIGAPKKDGNTYVVNYEEKWDINLKDYDVDLRDGRGEPQIFLSISTMCNEVNTVKEKKNAKNY